MRTIEGWTDEEIKALKRLKDGGYDVYNKIVRYMHGSSDGILSNKLIWGNRTENNQLIYDIVDYWRGDAEFPKKKYQIKFSFTSESIFLFEKDKYVGFVTSANKFIYPSESFLFTMDEIKAMDERLVPFAVEVEE